MFETIKFQSMEVPQIYNRREAEKQREKWGKKSVAAWSCHGEIAEAQGKAIRKLPQGLLEKHSYKWDWKDGRKSREVVLQSHKALERARTEEEPPWAATRGSPEGTLGNVLLCTASLGHAGSIQ